VEEVFTTHVLTLSVILVMRNLAPSKIQPVEEISFLWKAYRMTIICKAYVKSKGRRIMLPASDC